MTGAWSLAPVPPRSSRSISAPVTRAANAGEPSTKSMRMEGKDYVMADGDVVEFRFNV